jgi:hypothetical protein
MVEFRVWYWTNTRYLTHGLVPTEADFKRDYRVLPIFNLVVPGTGKTALDLIFERYNADENPMGTRDMQAWIGNNLQPHPHTSMSPGDIVELEGELWLCNAMGWGKLPYKTVLLGDQVP